MTYITRDKLQKENELLKIIIAIMLITFISLYFFRTINLIEARNEVKAYEMVEEAKQAKKQDPKHVTPEQLKINKLNARIEQLVKENKTLSDMRPVHGVVSEY